jgi:hypothetical protein
VSSSRGARLRTNSTLLANLLNLVALPQLWGLVKRRTRKDFQTGRQRRESTHVRTASWAGRKESTWRRRSSGRAPMRSWPIAAAAPTRLGGIASNRCWAPVLREEKALRCQRRTMGMEET